MPTHGAFLRGMNIGGRRITNEGLRKHLARLGLDDVATFRASGNVVFTAAQGSDAQLARLIERGLERGLGYAVPAYVRSAEEIRAIAAETPFPQSRVQASTGKLHVALLGAQPRAPVQRQALALAGKEDLLAFGERALYWLPSGRMIDSGLDLRALEQMVGPWTMRTKATIEQLAAKHLAAAPAGG